MIEGSSRWDGLWLALGLVLCAPGCTDAKIFRCANGTPTLVGSSYVCETSDAGSDAGQDASSDAGQDASSDAGGDAGSDAGTCAAVTPALSCSSNPSICSPSQACEAWWGDNICRKTCAVDSDCTSVHARSLCIEFQAGVLGCSIPCNPGDDTTCPSGKSCSYFADPVHGTPRVFTECRPLATSAALFSRCDPANVTLCGANAAWWYSTDATNTAGTDAPRCVRQCRIGHDEDCVDATGTTCKGNPAYGPCDQTYGVCTF